MLYKQKNELLDKKIKDCGFTTRVVTSLTSNGIHYVRHLISVSRDTIFRLPNLGEKSFKEINDFLEKNDIQLWDGISKINKQSSSVCLDEYSYAKILNVATIENIFIKYGGLKINTFSVYLRILTDNTVGIYFDCPEDMDSQQARDFSSMVHQKLLDLSMLELFADLY